MFKIPRLEQALLLVEETAQDFRAIWQIQFNEGKVTPGPNGLAVNQRKFRNYLLSLKDEANSPDFQISEDFLFPDMADEYFGAITGINIDLANWMAKSRRVYSLSATMAAQLALTPVDNVTWADVRLPFDAFAISLEEPITTRSGKIFDFVIVAKIKVDGQEYLVFDLLSPELRHFRRQSAYERKLIERLIKRKEYYRALQKIDSHRQSILRSLDNTEINSRFLIATDMLGNQPIHASLALLFNISKASMSEVRSIPRRSADPEEFTEWDEAANIVCGLCLYLAQNSRYIPYPDQKPSADYQPFRSGRPDYSAVSSVEDICSVANETVLTVSEMNIIRMAQGRTFEMSPHFRRGHWRTTLVDGEKKITWIHPTLVRADRLLPGTLPGGLVQKLE